MLFVDVLFLFSPLSFVRSPAHPARCGLMLMCALKWTLPGVVIMPICGLFFGPGGVFLPPPRPPTWRGINSVIVQLFGVHILTRNFFKGKIEKALLSLLCGEGRCVEMT